MITSVLVIWFSISGWLLWHFFLFIYISYRWWSKWHYYLFFAWIQSNETESFAIHCILLTVSNTAQLLSFTKGHSSEYHETGHYQSTWRGQPQQQVLYLSAFVVPLKPPTHCSLISVLQATLCNTDEYTWVKRKFESQATTQANDVFQRAPYQHASYIAD